MENCSRATFDAESIYAIRFAVSHLFLQISITKVSTLWNSDHDLTLKTENLKKQMSYQKTDSAGRFSVKKRSRIIPGMSGAQSVSEKN